MAESRQQRPGDRPREDDRDTGSPSPWAPPPQIQPHEAADHAGPAQATWPPEQTWQPEEVLTGEIEPGPIAQETDIYGNPVPGHYRTGARYADADAAVDNDHFSAGRTIWSEPQPRWAPEQPPPASFGSEAAPAPSGPGSGSPPIRPTLSSSLRPRGPVDATPSPSSSFTPPASPTSAFIPTQRTGDYVAPQPPRGGSGQNDHSFAEAAPTNNGPSYAAPTAQPLPGYAAPPPGHPAQPPEYAAQPGYPSQPPGLPPQPPPATAQPPANPSGYPGQPPGYPQQPPPATAQPPAHPSQLPGYPSQPPGYPQQPGYPSQPPGHPSQPPGHPSQPPGYPSEPQPATAQPGYAAPPATTQPGYPPPPSTAQPGYPPEYAPAPGPAAGHASQQPPVAPPRSPQPGYGPAPEPTAGYATQATPPAPHQPTAPQAAGGFASQPSYVPQPGADAGYTTQATPTAPHQPTAPQAAGGFASQPGYAPQPGADSGYTTQATPTAPHQPTAPQAAGGFASQPGYAPQPSADAGYPPPSAAQGHATQASPAAQGHATQASPAAPGHAAQASPAAAGCPPPPGAGAPPPTTPLFHRTSGHDGLADSATAASLAQQSTLSQQFSRRTSPAPSRATDAAAAPPTPTSAPPRIAPPPPKSSSASGRRWFVAIGATILAAAIAAGALVGLNLANRDGDKQPASLAGASCGGKPVLTVAVAPEFASIVEKAAANIPDAAGGCAPVKVAAQPPAATLSQLASNPPDAWIPPSTAWLRMSGPRRASAPGSNGPQLPSQPASAAPSQAGPGLFAPDAVSLARSPVVVAAPKPFADANGWPDKQLGWAQLTAGVVSHQIPKFSMGNPLRDTASLLAVLGVQVAMAGTTKDPGIAEMRALTLRARLADADADSAALLKTAAGLTDPATAAQQLGLFPVTEQQLWQYSRENPKIQLAGIYPADTLMEADYPLAVTTKTAGDQARRNIATQLADLITARTFIGNLTDQGFRPSAKTAATAGAGVALAPNATGLLAQYARPVPLPPTIAEPAAIWAQYKQLSFQTLILVDGSGSMNNPVTLRDGTKSTKADLLRLAGAQAAALYGEETSLGMWLFATPTPTSPPFTVAVPFGPVNDKINGVPRRDVMRAAASQYKAIPDAGTPLFETVLRGVEDMKKRQKPNTVTMVVVLTDGRDEQSPYAMSQQQFLQRLGALEDRAHPVPVFAIGYGADADMNGLSQMSKATGGQAVASNDPGDLASAVAKIFLAAHLR